MTTDPSGYETVIRRIGDMLRRSLEALWADLQHGDITDDDFMDLAATVIAAGNAQARNVALMSLAAYVQAKTGEDMDVSEHVVHDLERGVPSLQRAMKTILAKDDDDIPTALERIALAEPASAGAQAFKEGIGQSGATGWTRGLDSDPCELCRWWWRDGRVYRVDHDMPDHPGCCCVPLPVFGGPTPPATKRAGL